MIQIFPMDGDPVTLPLSSSSSAIWDRIWGPPFEGLRFEVCVINGLCLSRLAEIVEALTSL